MAKNRDNILFRVHVVENVFKGLRARSIQNSKNVKLVDFLDRDISDTEFIKIFTDGNPSEDEIVTRLETLRTYKGSWRTSISDTTKQEYKDFVNKSVTDFKDMVKQITEENEQKVSDTFKPIEITKFVLKIENFTSKLDSFTNGLNLTVDSNKSLTGLPATPEEKKLLENLQENDIIILSYQLPGEENTNVRFVGFITTSKVAEAYGTVSKKMLDCSGISKVLGLSSVAADPALVQYQPTDQLGTQEKVATPYTNIFSNKNSFDIFKLIINNILFSSESTNVAKDLETSNDLKNLGDQATRQANIMKVIEANLGKLQSIKDSNPTITPNQTFPFEGQQIKLSDIDKNLIILRKKRLEESNRFFDIVMSTQAQAITKKKFNIVRGNVITTETAKEIAIEIKALSGTLLADVQDTITFLLDLKLLKDTTSRTSLHLNYSLMLTYALTLKKIGQDKELHFVDNDTLEGLVGEFDKRIANSSPFDVLLKNGEFKTFYTDFQTPEQILSGMRASLFLDFFEDRPGRIVCRNPKYNDWPNNPSSKDFIIEKENILSYDVSRNDVALKSRSDYKLFQPLVGEIEFSNANFVDKDIVMQYGFRPESPRHNPNATTQEAASIFAALDLIKTNSSTRTMTVTVKNNREYKLGHLYFIPEIGIPQNVLDSFKKNNVPSILETIKTTALGNTLTDSDIRIGRACYLVEIATSIQPGQVSNHTLSFSLTRDAVQIGNFLNFKEIPNLLSALDLVNDLSMVPSSSFITELLNDRPSGALVCGQFLEDSQDQGEPKFVAVTRAASAELKTLLKSGGDTLQVDIKLRELIEQGRAFVTGFRKSSFQGSPCALATLLHMLAFWDIYLTIPNSGVGIYKKLKITDLIENTRLTKRVKRIYNHRNHKTEVIETKLVAGGSLGSFVQIPTDGVIHDFESNKTVNLMALGIETNDATIRIALPKVPNSVNGFTVPVLQGATTTLPEGSTIFPITKDVGTKNGALLFDANSKFVKTFIKYPLQRVPGVKFRSIEVVNISIPSYKQISIANLVNSSSFLVKKQKDLKTTTTVINKRAITAATVTTASAGVDTANGPIVEPITETITTDATLTSIVDAVSLTITSLEIFNRDDITLAIQSYKINLNDDLDKIVSIEEQDFSTKYRDIIDAIMGGEQYVTIPLRDRAILRTNLINSLKNNLAVNLITAVDSSKADLPRSLLPIIDNLRNNQFDLAVVDTQNLDTNEFTSASASIVSTVNKLAETGTQIIIGSHIRVLKSLIGSINQ